MTIVGLRFDLDLISKLHCGCGTTKLSPQTSFDAFDIKSGRSPTRQKFGIVRSCLIVKNLICFLINSVDYLDTPWSFHVKFSRVNSTDISLCLGNKARVYSSERRKGQLCKTRTHIYRREVHRCCENENIGLPVSRVFSLPLSPGLASEARNNCK